MIGPDPDENPLGEINIPERKDDEPAKAPVREERLDRHRAIPARNELNKRQTTARQPWGGAEAFA